MKGQGITIRQRRFSVLALSATLLLVCSCASYKTQYSKEARRWKDNAWPESAKLKHTMYLIGDAGKPTLNGSTPVLHYLKPKLLARNCEVLIFDEPTRGIDVGAKYEIYLLMNELAAAGKAIIMISSELPEVLGVADRILVMHEGRVTGEIADARRATQEQIMQLAVA